MMIRRKGILALGLGIIMSLGLFQGCTSKEEEKVIIYTNSDEECIKTMEDSLNNSGFKDKFIITGMGTSELGGKLLAEGKSIEADVVTMSSYYIESAKEKNQMFVDLTFDTNSIEKYPAYYTPILANTGAIFINTNVLKEKGFEEPKSIKDLTDPKYKNLISIPNILDSSTAWLLVQAIISEYGEKEGEEVLKGLVVNAGPHIESSGSGPIKKVRAGEVLAGFGLRHQGVFDKANGLPIDYIDPVEGNYSLTESIAVVDKGEEKNKLSMEIAKTIIEKSRSELIKYYPVALYKGEKVDEKYKPKYSKVYKEKLTVDLLKEHQDIFKKAMGN